MTKISIIIPCYYNEENIPITSKRLIENEPNFPNDVLFEYVMVDDGSKDNTFKQLEIFHQQHPQKVKLVKLASNVGSYNAILAGMNYATGDCCVVITADLQDPPELIPKMFHYWQQGFKLILANRIRREDPFFSKLFSKLYHRLVKRFALKNLPSGGFDFTLFDKKLKEEVIKINEKNTNTLFLLPWLGYEYISIPYERVKREAGKSKWTVSKKIKLFIDSFVSFSFLPIRLISVSGIFFGILSLCYAAIILIGKVKGYFHVEGWSALMVVFLIVSSFQMIAIGVLGEYIWRTLDAVRNRPNYIVDKVIDTNKIN